MNGYMSLLTSILRINIYITDIISSLVMSQKSRASELVMKTAKGPWDIIYGGLSSVEIQDNGLKSVVAPYR